jgi:hypothetical protein
MNTNTLPINIPPKKAKFQELILFLNEKDQFEVENSFGALENSRPNLC